MSTAPMWLVYEDDDGDTVTRHYQPWRDVATAGVLINDIGNDMELVGWTTEKNSPLWAVYDEHGECVGVDVAADSASAALAEFPYATVEWRAQIQDAATAAADNADIENLRRKDAGERQCGCGGYGDHDWSHES